MFTTAGKFLKERELSRFTKPRPGTTSFAFSRDPQQKFLYATDLRRWVIDVLNRETLEPAPAQASYIANRMRERGILLSTDGPFHNVLKIKPPLVFTRENADFLVATLDEILAENFCAGASY